MKNWRIFLALALVAGCASHLGSSGGTVVMDVKPETRDDLAACGMGINSSTTVALKAAIQMEKKSGQIDLGLKDELATEFSKRFSQADATKAMELYLGCMEKRNAARREDKKQTAITACKASWTCDANQASGYCTCNQVSRESQKERGLSELQTAKIIRENCTFNFQQCWSGQNLQKGRADCEAILSEAGIAIIKKSTPGSCKYEWPRA